MKCHTRKYRVTDAFLMIKISRVTFLTVTMLFFLASLVPVFTASASSNSHTLTVMTNSSSYSCRTPIIVNGTATGPNPKDKPVKVEIINDLNNQIYAHGKATVTNGVYSITFVFKNESRQGGPIFLVHASWNGATAETTTPFTWEC